MSPTAAANVTPTREFTPMFNRRQMLEMSPVRPSSPTLGQLSKSFGDARKEEAGEETSVLHPFVLSFTNLTYSVKTRRKTPAPTMVSPTKNGRGNTTVLTPPSTPDQMDGGDSSSTKTKVLLDNISGVARDGEIMAVLGASGSGKSTLIDALANRISKDRLKGTITLNREPLESRLLKVISAYVMQDDLLFPMLTVEETLMFAAEFRLPRTLSKSKKKLRVQSLIDQLGLRNAAKTVIGDEGHRGVSGGERRRVSIGIDIMHDPIILFLDEPTSGLDSTNAFMVVKVLKRIAQTGSIVITSIHQPSYKILGLLDKLIFLSRGHTVFSGSPTNLPQFFADFGHPIPENENPTEFALDLIRELEESPCGTTSLVEFNKTWQQTIQKPSPNRDITLKEAISESISRGKLGSGATNSMVQNYANPFWIEVALLSKRSMINSRRMPKLFIQKLGTVLVTGFILGTAFWQLDNSPKGIQEKIGFFGFAMSTAFYICAEAMQVFIQERYIFMRETTHNAYRRFSYCLSQALVSFPSLISLSLVFSAITFWVVGLTGGYTGFLFYLGIILASFWAGNSFVTFLSGVVPHVMLGYTIVVAILTCFRLLSGFFITRDQIPKYWIWFHYISLVKYPYDAVLQNEFNDPIKCSVRGIQIFDNTPIGMVPEVMKERLLDNISKTLGKKITESTCVTTGADVLNQHGITDLSKWTCLWITVAWGFFFRILFYLTLLLGSKNKRR